MQIIPYVNFRGSCREAMTAYAAILGTQPPEIFPFSALPEADKAMLPPGVPEDAVMNAALRIGDAVALYGSDDVRPDAPVGAGFAVNVTVPAPEEARRIYDALAQGGTITMPLSETFWSPAFGMLEDRFGVAWMVMAEPVEG
ncbi:VOC family protein [Salipiger sp.]|uniref:VOC family protein n=1 Tax=Salipiger sp. TaxID=2078585 RepID=UPI003A96B0D7